MNILQSSSAPVAHFAVNVCSFAPDLSQCLLGEGKITLLRNVFGALDRDEQPQSLRYANQTSYSQDEPPVGVVAEEVTQKLGDQNANVAHDLGEGAEEALLRGRGNF
jgi:hypothetical protein